MIRNLPVLVIKGGGELTGSLARIGMFGFFIS